MKIISWNVNGIRALLRKVDFKQFLKSNKPDILCLNEIKAPKLPLDKLNPNNYFKFISWNPAEIKKGGYAGTLILSNIESHKIIKSPFDNEGRFIMMEFDKFILINLYVPNSGQKGLKRLKYRTEEWDIKLRNYVKKLKKPVILTGDFNVAFNKNIDVWNPNYKNIAGVTPQERDNFSKMLDNGYVDAFRYKHPKTKKYSYYSYFAKSREKNKGWRIDYFLVDKSLKNKIKDSNILDKQLGSDHVPITLSIEI